MKKKLLWVLGVLAALLILATVIGPHLILAAVRQETPAESYAYSESFLTSYDEIRAHLAQRMEQMKAAGTVVESESYAVDESDDWYIES